MLGRIALTTDLTADGQDVQDGSLDGSVEPDYGGSDSGGDVQDTTADTGDSASPDGSPTDTLVDLGPNTDAEDDGVTQPVSVEAVPGEKCTVDNMIGTVTLARWGDGQPGLPQLSANINEKTDPWTPEAEFGNQACTFYKEKSRPFCTDCGYDSACIAEETCVPLPVPAQDIVVVVSAGEQSQTFEPNQGYTWGDLNFAADSYSMDIRWAQYTVLVPSMAIPTAVENLVTQLSGNYDDPGPIDITWTPRDDGGYVHTRVPINHHAGGPTFTDCAAHSSEGGFTIPKDMLAPLAVSTGLEFQGVEQVNYAAALLPHGCLLIRYQITYYPNLIYN